MNTRARVTTIPAILAAGALASMPVLKTLAAQGSATPAASPATVPAAWAELGLPELELQFTSEAVSGMPESVEAGRYLLTIHGQPTPEDYAFGPLFLRIPDDMTLDDLMAAAGEAADAPPDFYYQATIAGGPAIVAATGATSAVGVIDLVPGNWIVAGNALEQPPVPFTVTGEMPATLPEPESNATFTIGEYVINLSAGELTTGENLVKIENIGVQPHFVEVSKVPDGTANENIEATIAGFMGGTPEAEPLAEEDFVTVGTSSDQSGQTTIWTTFTFDQPGTYAALCWIPDPESMMPHAFMGMHTVFEVA